MRKYLVTLFFRKLRRTGNFSIESSFQQMMDSFPADSEFTLTKFTSSYFSNAILPRFRAMLEVRSKRSHINHVTGDVHFLVLGLPRQSTILTIHDCGFMNHSNPAARFLLRLIWLKLPVWHCKYVTTVSEATRQEVIKYTGCTPEKVIVIPTIISSDFSKNEKWCNENKPRILHIGMAPNKNFERHVQALEEFNCILHIIGKLDEEHIAILEKYNIEWESEHNITQDEMKQAYEKCDLLLFASTLEGFGMPIIEAQTVGRPVITSNLSSMPEVAGQGACLVDPYSVSSIREGISKVIRDSSYRDHLIEKGFENIKRFSAEKVALQYEELYKRVVTT